MEQKDEGAQQQQTTTQAKKRVGILTGGGDCPGLNAVIRAACTTLAVAGYELLGLYDGFEGLLNEKHVVLSPGKVVDIYLRGGTILGTTNCGNFTFPLKEEIIKRAAATYHKLGLCCLIVIGGDGTMSIANRLAGSGINFVGVPKTIDNDLMSTDMTFGFDSAVSVVTDALGRLHTTASSHHRVMIVEVMGRNAGWIALASGVAGGAKIILIPEIKWRWETLVEVIKQRDADPGPRYTLICLAEGAVLPEGGQIGAEKGNVTKESDKLKLGGVGQHVCDRLAQETGFETRSIVLGHVQRGGTPTSFDRILATKFGACAAKLVSEGKYGKMVGLRGTKIVEVDVTDEIEKQRTIKPETDQLVWSARMVGTIFGDEDLQTVTEKALW